MQGLATGLRNQGGDKSPIHLRNIEGVVGSRSDDIIRGNDEANFLFGYQGQDTIFGGGGSDYIDASGLIGASLFGGAGNDIFALGPAESAFIDGGEGSDVLELKTDQSFRLDVFLDSEAAGDITNPLFNVAGWNVDLLAGSAESEFYEAPVYPETDVPFTYIARLTSVENILGSDFDDLLQGNLQDNLINGRLGDDTLIGLAGDDTLYGDAGNDSLVGGIGHDVLNGGEGSDTLLGGEGDDLLFLGAGDEGQGGLGKKKEKENKKRRKPKEI